MNNEIAFDAPTYELSKYIGKAHIERTKYRNGKSVMRNMYNVREHWKKDVDELEIAPKFITKRPYGGICKVCGVRICRAFFDYDPVKKKKNGSNSLKKAKGTPFSSRNDEKQEMIQLLKIFNVNEE